MPKINCKKLLAILLLSASFSSLNAQSAADSAWTAPAVPVWSFIHPNENLITQADQLAPVLKKLLAIQMKKKGVVRIVHIGDSHLQADLMSSIVRNGIQDFFGNAGRGLVFPYQLAKSNAPADIISSSNITWQYNRLAHPEISIVNGLSGFGIHTTQPEAMVTLRLKEVNGTPQYFNKIQFFLGDDSSRYLLEVNDNNSPVSLATKRGHDNPSLIYQSDSLLSEFTLTRNSPGEYAFYGVSLERSNTPGVVYNTIGVNGAQYEQFSNTPLFWKQLPALNADLFIVSLGTNEAQNQNLNEDSLIAKCNYFLQQIKTAAPNAVVLVTTPAGSYYRGSKPNAALAHAANALIRFAQDNHLPYWDLYHISSGYSGAVAWKKYGLMSHDLVHYSAKGYQLQGQLFFYALAKAYNDYRSKQSKTTTP